MIDSDLMASVLAYVLSADFNSDAVYLIELCVYYDERLVSLWKAFEHHG